MTRFTKLSPDCQANLTRVEQNLNPKWRTLALPDPWAPHRVVAPQVQGSIAAIRKRSKGIRTRGNMSKTMQPPKHPGSQAPSEALSVYRRELDAARAVGPKGPADRWPAGPRTTHRASPDRTSHTDYQRPVLHHSGTNP